LWIAPRNQVMSNRIGRTVGGAVCSEVDLDLADVGSGQVVDRNHVGAAKRVDVERLRTVHIHDDGCDVAGQSYPRAVGRDVDLLGDVGAVEDKRVVAGLPFNRVVAVARVPDERVVTRAHGCHVATATADNEIVARTADDPVVAVTAI
jgi:hypothetical protein